MLAGAGRTVVGQQASLALLSAQQDK